MRLVRLAVERFQCIESAELDFGPGLNVLYGPNDLGKSSLAWAIRAVLLLQHNSAAHGRFVSWYGDGEPRVALTLSDDEDRLWRVTKTFGSSAGRSLLEASRDGRTFTTDASGRQVDEKLRTMFGWGVQKPGGQGPRGLPESFLTQVLLAEQDSVRKVLFDTSLAKDPDETGRLRLVEALGALAQDPLFKQILDETQASVDKAFTPKGRKKRTADSPFLEVATQLNERQAQHDELSRRVRETEAAEAKIRELGLERDQIHADLSEATETLLAARRDLATRTHRDELEAQRAAHHAAIRGVDELQESIERLDGELVQRRAAVGVCEAAFRAAETTSEAAEAARDAARHQLDALAHDDASHEARERALEEARDDAQRQLADADRALACATSALSEAEKVAGEVDACAGDVRAREQLARTAEQVEIRAKEDLGLAQRAHDQAKERAREARSDARVQARELARKDLENRRLQRNVDRGEVEREREAAADVGDHVARAAKARQVVAAQRGRATRDAQLVATHEAKLAVVAADAAGLRQLDLVGEHRQVAAFAAEMAREDEAVAQARTQAVDLRRAEAELRATIRPNLPSAEVIAALRELRAERRTAEARLGGGITVALRPKQPLQVTGEADGVALAARGGREATVIAARQVLRLDLGDVAELEVTAGEEGARQAATALHERWRREAASLFVAHGVDTLEALEALRREADELERDAERLQREAAGHEERAARRRAAGDASAAAARRDELAAELADVDLAALGDQLGRLGDRWQAVLKQRRDDNAADRDAAVAALEQARAQAARGQDDLKRLTDETDALDREAERRQADLTDLWSAVVAACDERLVEIDRDLAELDRQAAQLLDGGDDERRVAEAALREATATLDAHAKRHAASLATWQSSRDALVAAMTRFDGAKTRARELEFAREWSVELESRGPVLPLGRWQAAVAAATTARGTAQQVRATADQQLVELQAERARLIKAARAAVAAADEAAGSARTTRATRQHELTAATERSSAVDAAMKEAQLRLAQTNVDSAKRAIVDLDQQLAALPDDARSIDADDVAYHEKNVERLTAHLAEATEELAKARGGLEQVGGAIVREQLLELEQALQQARERARQVELEFDGWKLLLETLRASESTEGAHLGRALAGPVSNRFRQLTSGRYGNLELGAHLDATGLRVAGELREISALSAGTQDQLATLLRLCIAEQLRSAIVLDDHLSQSDPARVAWFNAVLRGAAQQVQVVLITCRPAELLGPDEFPRSDETTFSGAAGLLRAVDLTRVIRRFA